MAAQMEAVFRALDKSGSGTIKSVTLVNALQKIGIEGDTISVVLDGFDQHGEVNYSEFIERLFRDESSLVQMIVVTGGPCGGKSSAMASLSAALAKKGVDMYAVPEVPTIIFGAGAKFPGIDGGQQLMEFEMSVIEMQLSMERSFLRIAKSTGRPSVLVCDRGLLDIAAYLPPETWERILAKQGLTEAQIMSRYAGVLHLVTAADGAEKFYKSGHTVDDSGAAVYRQESPQQARELDAKVQACWARHPKVCRAANLDDGFEGKMARSTQFVLDLIQ